LKKRVLVVDLDGTLFNINTFHYFIKFLLLHCIRRLNFILFFRLCFALFSRVISSHARMKYKVLFLLKNRKDIDYQIFVNSVASEKRDLSQYINGGIDIKILATAAPSCYAGLIAKNEGFDLCLGTDFTSLSFNEAFENVREVKKENVLNCLKLKGAEYIDTFITDHKDDLPLIMLAKKNIIVRPNQELLTALKQNSISFEVIN